MTDISSAASLADAIENIGHLAEQAAAEGFYGLQDVGLLIVEALSPLPSDTVSPELLADLARLSEWFSEYSFGSEAVIPAIIGVFRYPGLQAVLTEDELATLAERLEADMAVQNLAGGDWGGDAFFDDTYPPPPTDVPPISKETEELVELLEMEAALISRLLSAIDLNAPETLVGHLETLGDNLERYVNAANMAGFEGLALVCGHVNSNIRLYRDNPELFAAPQWQTLQNWVANVTDYLSHFNETGAGVAMLPQLGDAAWLLPIGMETAAAIMVRLQSTGNEASNGEPGVRKQTATADDITLALPEDVNQELLDILLQELPIQTQAFSTAIQSLHTGGSLADLDAAQRIAHNLKGAANTVGIKGIAQLTHYLEDVLVACAQQQQLPTSGLLDSLIAAADCLEAMSESLAGMAPPPDEAMGVLQNILEWANRIDSEGIEVVVSAVTSSMTAPPPIPTHTDIAITQAEAEPSEKAQAAMVRIEAEQLERLFRQAGENIIINTQANERLRRMKGHLQTMQEQFDLLRRLADELEQLVDLKDLSGNPTAASAAQHDALEMDQYNELHTASRRMVEAAFDARELSRDTGKELEEMGRLLEDQQRLATETQETVMATRLVPINSIFQRLQRSLRQTCRLTGKECDLEFTGDQMMVHGDTPNAMIDPIMHLLRNAVDHGIESGAERLALGKPLQGKITVDFERDGNHILVRVRDDGRGLDFAAIRAMAEQRGVIAPGQAASEDDLKQVILRPNFSTRAEATQTSGRGVGMDVVNYQVQAQGGTLALHSVPGQGLTVEMKIPLPLSRSHALLAQLGPYRVALANKGIRQILFAADGELIEADGGQQLHIDGGSYPAITLSRLLNLPEHHKPGQPYRSALLVQNGQQTTAVMLDTVTHGLDIVVKDFGFYIKKIPGFIGATILGDGLVAPVLDIPELLLMADGTDGYAAYFSYAELLPQASTLPSVLVVDDSLSQRRALEQLLHDAGFQVTTARDGIEAAEQLDAFTPDIVLTDLEMPRMNGLELTAHIRINDSLKAVPVVMITSRTTQMHRNLAEEAGVNLYLVKPVREDDLLADMQRLIDAAATA